MRSGRRRVKRTLGAAGSTMPVNITNRRFGGNAVQRRKSTIVNNRPRSGPDGTRSRQSSIPVVLSFLAPSAPLCRSPPRAVE